MEISRAFALLVVIPSFFLSSALPVLAAVVPAGFAPGQIWLSQSSPSAGSSVRVFTVVYDASPTAIEGSVAFKVDGSTIGSSPFSLDAGESAFESIIWTAHEGSHSVSAEITSAVEKKSKQAVTVGTTSSSIISVTVLPEAPKPAAVEAINSAQSVVASSTPIVAGVVAATTATTESIRKAGEAYLTKLAGDTIATTTATTTKKSGSVLGASTEVAEASTTPASNGGYLQKLARTLLPLFRYPAFFYPVFLGIILFVLWLLAKRLRDPKKR